MGAKTAACIILLLVASRLGSAAHAATPYTETFDASLAGWTAARFGSASAVSGHAQLQFNVQGGPPTPQTGVFSATNTSSGGAFYGDWSTARVAFVGVRRPL